MLNFIHVSIPSEIIEVTLGRKLCTCISPSKIQVLLKSTQEPIAWSRGDGRWMLYCIKLKALTQNNYLNHFGTFTLPP